MRLLYRMKRRIAWGIAIISGTALGITLVVPDPLPFVDEAVFLAVFVKSMSYLGYDVTRWIPFLGKGKKKRTAASKGQTINV